MIRIAPSQLRDGAVAAHVTAACFGEAGMHDRPECAARRPIAAGLFGVGQEAAPPLLPRGIAGRV
jgi:hypothetical protein